MENATKALMIAAGVLMGVMILSLGVSLYYSLSTYVKGTQETIDANALNKFNNSYLNYINVSKDEHGALEYNYKLNVQDIITVANMAIENNLKYELTSADAGEKSYYVKVKADLYKTETDKDSFQLEDYLRTNRDEKIQNILSTYIGEHEYYCTNTDIKISPVTGRVYEINFK